MKRLIVVGGVFLAYLIMPSHVMAQTTPAEWQTYCTNEVCNTEAVDQYWGGHDKCVQQCINNHTNPQQSPVKFDANGNLVITDISGDCASPGMKLNVPIAGMTCVKDFAAYFQTIYSFILGAVAILSTVMIMWGGFKWLTSRGSSGDIGEAKKIITSSIIGLVLAFLSFTILYLVNPKLTVIGLPQLTTVNLEVNEAKLTPLTTQNYQHPTTAPGKWNSGTYTQDEQAVRTALTGPDIGATIQGNNPPCVDSNGNQISYQSYLAQNNNNHCTTLASLPNTAIEGLKKIRSSCPNCELEITGGTELGHDEHGAGRAVVDLDTNGVLDVYINKFPVENGRHTLPGGGTALNEGDHWHLEY